MQLIGMLDSPYVRRVAISAQFLGIELDSRPLSVFNDLDELRIANPLLKAPTLVCDDGTVLVDSSLIIDYLSKLSTNTFQMWPRDGVEYRSAIRITGIGLVVMEKVVQVTYETMRRPKESQHEPWLDRLLDQLHSALRQLQESIDIESKWSVSENICQADITAAVAWRVSQYILADYVDSSDYEKLQQFSGRAEALAEFRACDLPA